MRKLIASVFVSLDGYIEGANEDISWVMDNFNDQTLNLKLLRTESYKNGVVVLYYEPVRK